jgi:hypothetical protein
LQNYPGLHLRLIPQSIGLPDNFCNPVAWRSHLVSTRVEVQADVHELLGRYQLALLRIDEEAQRSDQLAEKGGLLLQSGSVLMTDQPVVEVEMSVHLMCATSPRQLGNYPSEDLRSQGVPEGQNRELEGGSSEPEPKQMTTLRGDAYVEIGVGQVYAHGPIPPLNGPSD